MQTINLQRNFAQNLPVTAPLEKLSRLKKKTLQSTEVFNIIVPSITSWSSAVQQRGDFVKFPNIWWKFIALRLIYPCPHCGPHRVEFELVKWCPYSQIDTIDDTQSGISKADQNTGKTERKRDFISQPEKSKNSIGSSQCCGEQPDFCFSIKFRADWFVWGFSDILLCIFCPGIPSPSLIQFAIF